MNGTDMEHGIFDPNGTVTRGMVVTVLYRLAGEPDVKGTCPFTDLTADWYYDAVLWASQTGITKGRSATEFAPDVPVFRDELVTFIMRYTAFTGKDVSERDDLAAFKDRGAVPDWALDAMQWAVKTGIRQALGQGCRQITAGHFVGIDKSILFYDFNALAEYYVGVRVHDCRAEVIADEIRLIVRLAAYEGLAVVAQFTHQSGIGKRRAHKTNKNI